MYQLAKNRYFIYFPQQSFEVNTILKPYLKKFSKRSHLKFLKLLIWEKCLGVSLVGSEVFWKLLQKTDT